MEFALVLALALLAHLVLFAESSVVEGATRRRAMVRADELLARTLYLATS